MPQIGTLPPELLERQAQRELKRTVMEMQGSGFSDTEIVARENQLRKDAHNRTARLLKEHFILEKDRGSRRNRR